MERIKRWGNRSGNSSLVKLGKGQEGVDSDQFVQVIGGEGEQGDEDYSPCHLPGSGQVTWGPHVHILVDVGGRPPLALERRSSCKRMLFLQ